MIEKIDPLDIVSRENLVSKINELIEAHNKLEVKLGGIYPSVDLIANTVTWQINEKTS